MDWGRQHLIRTRCPPILVDSVSVQGARETMLLVPMLAYILEWAVFGGLVTYSHCPRCGDSFRRRTEGSERTSLDRGGRMHQSSALW